MERLRQLRTKGGVTARRGQLNNMTACETVRPANGGSGSIELKVGASKALNDFSLASLSGRVGQGLAILYGHRLGLKFSAHLRSYVESLPAGSPGAVHKGEAMADFLFADTVRTVLIESKGSFTPIENDQLPSNPFSKAC